MSTMDAIDLLIEHKPARYGAPDGRFLYNNSNYVVLAAIIATVTGQDFAVYMKEAIFDKAGMKNTAVVSKAMQDKIPTDVVGHERVRRRPAVQDYLDGP